MVSEADFAILGFIQESMRCEMLDWLMPKVTMLGEFGMLWIVVAVVMLLVRKHRRCGAMLACGLLSGVIVGNLLLKNIVARARPCWLDTSVNMLIAIPADYSFPSGHTLACFIAATVLMRYDKRFGIPALIMAFLIAFSRMYLYVHFPSDVLCGALLGIGIDSLVYALFDRFLPDGKFEGRKALTAACPPDGL